VLIDFFQSCLCNEERSLLRFPTESTNVFGCVVKYQTVIPKRTIGVGVHARTTSGWGWSVALPKLKCGARGQIRAGFYHRVTRIVQRNLSEARRSLRYQTTGVIHRAAARECISKYLPKWSGHDRALTAAERGRVTSTRWRDGTDLIDARKREIDNSNGQHFLYFRINPFGAKDIK